MDEYEEILASKRVIRVLGIVAEFGELTITGLARKAGIDHMVADMIVKQLTEAGLLLDEYEGRSRIVAPNFRRLDVLFTRGNELEVIKN